jgi:hypothetical protein
MTDLLPLIRKYTPRPLPDGRYRSPAGGADVRALIDEVVELRREVRRLTNLIVEFVEGRE